MIPGGGNPNNNMGMPGFGIPLPGTGIISAPPIITGSRIAMGIQPSMMGGIMPGGGLGMMPNPMMGGQQIPQGMFPGIIQNAGQPNIGMPMQMQIEQPEEFVEPALRKVFVKNIPEDVPDTFMESLLKECGNVTQWKRTKNEKDIPIPFGSCEFATVEGVLRCLRVMNNLKLLNSYLQIKPSEKTEAFIGEWAERKKKEWLATNKDKTIREEDFERYLQKDDAKALENIHILIDNFDVNKVREEREKESEKKEHPKEKERDRRKKAYLKELEKNFKKELSKWLDYEDKIEKDYRKEREREKERDQDKERLRQRLLEKQLEYDSEDERRRKNDTKYLEQRKKARQKELEEDELERRKEIMEEERKAQEEAQMEIEPPPENIIPIAPHDEDHNTLTKPEKPKSRASKFSVITVEPGVQETPAPVENFSSTPFQIEINPQKGGKSNVPAQSVFSQEKAQNEEDEQQLYNRKHKINVKIDKPTEVTQNIVTFDLKKKQAVIEFDVATPVQNSSTTENQKVLQDLESLVRQIPRNKTDLFNYKMNWTLLATSDLIEKKVKPWLCKQSVDLLGQEEMDFVNVVLKRLANRESPQNILKKVEKLLDEEAEDFMMKLWRMLIFELLKLENNLE